MSSPHKTVLLIGDQTDPWIDGIDYIAKKATRTPWLRAFMDDLCSKIKAEIRGMEPAVVESLGSFSSLYELADRFRHASDETGVANALLIHAVRAAMLLQCVKREPHLLGRASDRPELLGISGGLLSLAAVAVASDFESLYEACLWIGGLMCRLCRLCYIKSRCTQDRPGTWGWLVLGVSTEKLREEMRQFHTDMGIPEPKQAQVAVHGDRWTTLVGPPTVLTQFLTDCPAVSSLSKSELNIHSLQHSIQTTAADLDYMVGISPLCDRPVGAGCKVWGMDGGEPAAGALWGDLLRAAILQALSRPLDVIKVVDGLKKGLGTSSSVDIKAMGASGHLSYISSALAARGRTVNVQQELAAEPLATDDRPSSGRIAIVGMAGRGPGSADLDEFWNVILTGQDLHSEIPPDRFDLAEFGAAEHGDGDTDTPQCTVKARFGCFMDKPGNFDARFFRISPREALFVDPGHRLFLMSAHDALDAAGYAEGRTRSVDATRIGVFFGQTNDDWHIMAHGVKGCDAYTMPGSQRAFGPGRLAFHMGWEGPTYSLDSACASSSTAMHLACMSLLAHDIDMAVSGAANVIGYPHAWSCLGKSGVLSTTGNCKPFRDDADGYCRADFVGSVVLKRLEDAVAHHDNILAVVAGSGRNHSGNSTSITTSDAGAQERLYRRVLRGAGVRPDEVSYVEMHGTGTQIGDPAEVGAVSRVFAHRRADSPLVVGSIKGNIGHSEAAAGMSALMKAILMFQHNTLPPQAGMPHRLNPHFPALRDANIEILAQPREYASAGDEPRRILLNNFDAAGGNACLLIEEYKPRPVLDSMPLPWQTHVVATSAKTPSSLRAYKKKLLRWLHEHPGVGIHDLAYTTTARRLHHQARSAYVAPTVKDLVAQLEADVNAAEPSPSARAAAKRPVVFVFTGQGAHYAGMGAQMYAHSLVFRRTVDHCAQIAADFGFPPFVDLITDRQRDASAAEPVQVHLAVLTLEIALAAAWTSDAGVAPAMVVGHSLGEYAALHVAGVLSLTDVLYLVGRRATLLAQLCEPASCAMLAVAAPADTVQTLIDAQGDASSCSVACANSPHATVVGGTVDDVATLRAAMPADVRASTLPIPFAFHSCQMDALVEAYTAVAQGVSFLAPLVPVASTLLAAVVDAPGTFDAAYLGRQTRQPVRFADAVGAVRDRLGGDALWLEIGPAQVCGAFVLATLAPALDARCVMSTLERGADNWVSFSKCLATLYAQGVDVDWARLYLPYASSLQLLPLPAYAWELQDYWITYKEERSAGASQGAAAAPSAHRQMLSTCAQRVVEEKATADSLEVTLQALASEPGFNALVEGHRIRDVPICPGSAFVDAAVAAARYALEASGRTSTGSASASAPPALTIRNLALQRPLSKTSPSADANMQLLTTAVLRKPSSSSSSGAGGDIAVSFSAAGYSLGECTVSVSDAAQVQAGWAKTSYFVRSRMAEIVRAASAGRGHRMAPDILYALFARTVQYHAAFKCVTAAFVAEGFGEAVADVVLQPDPPGTRFASSPYHGEALVHLAGFVLNADPARPRAADTTFMMDTLGAVEQPDAAALRPGAAYRSYVRVARRDKDSAECDVYVFAADDDDGALVMQCSGLRFHEVSNCLLDRLLGKPSAGGAADGAAGEQRAATTTTDKPKTTRAQATLDTKTTTAGNAPAPPPPAAATAETRLLDAILASIARETGTEVAALTDDVFVGDLGVDSIMAIEITAAVRKATGADIPISFMIDHPTIGQLRREYGGGDAASSSSSSSSSSRGEHSASSSASSEAPTPAFSPTSDMVMVEYSDILKPAPASQPQPPTAVKDETPSPPQPSPPAADPVDISALPKARITLLQGRPSSGQPPLYLIADGTGSIATYLHLPPLQSKCPIYGIDSPFARCPEQLTAAIGIPTTARIMVDALLQHLAAHATTPTTAPLRLGGFSGGAMLAYEVTRQLAARGRAVDGLVLIDMCCPRAAIDPARLRVAPDAGWHMYQQLAARDAFWAASSAASAPMQHLQAFFRAVAAYHPPAAPLPLPPRRVAVIWAERGLVARSDPALRRELAARGFPVDPYAGFMEDAALGAIAWGVPHKRPADLGPNGWDRFVGKARDDVFCQSVAADHLEMLAPGHVHLFHGALVKVLEFFDRED